MGGALGGALEPAEIARAIVGLALLAWFPGWTWSHALLPDLSRIERGVFAIGLSVAWMVLALYIGNTFLDIPVTAASAIWWSLAITAAGATLALARRRNAGAPRRG